MNRRYISKKDYTIKCEIVQTKTFKSRSFQIIKLSNEIFQQQRGLTRRKSCYSSFFGYMNQFQNQNHNILPEFKTKQFTQEKETKETYRRQTQIAEDTVIRKFRSGLQDLTKCKTVIQSLKILQNRNKKTINFINKSRSLYNRIESQKIRRNSCRCLECGQQSQFQQKHQNDPYFSFFNNNEFLKRQIIKTNPKLKQIKNKFQSHIQNLKKCYIIENKSQINKYKSVSRTTNQLLQLSQTKLYNYSQRQSSIPSQRIKTELTQCSPKAFELKNNKNLFMNSRQYVSQSNFQKTIRYFTKDSFKSLASIYK